MAQTDQQPTVIVIDTLERLREYKSDTSTQTIQMLSRLKQAAVHMGEETTAAQASFSAALVINQWRAVSHAW